MTKPILIISYFFPPYPGVGGRRWAKFAKYLAREGSEVHVLCARSPFSDVSTWMKDVEGLPNLTIHRIPALYPRHLLREPKTLLGRARYRAIGIALGLLTPGAMFDHGSTWQFVFVRKARALIRKYNIINVIATGAPFHVLLHSLKLKDCFPDIRLISDFRDPWSDAKRYISSLSPRRLEKERQAELKVLHGSDIVTTPSEEMTKKLQFCGTGTAFVTLHNGFDLEDIAMHKVAAPRNGDVIHVVYVGALEGETEEVLRHFFHALSRVKKESPLVYKRLRFSFLGRIPERYVKLVADQSDDQIRFLGEKSLPELYGEVREADYGLMFGRESPVFPMIVKFFEYLALRKSLFVVTSEERCVRYMSENKLGFCADLSSPTKSIEQFVRLHDAGGVGFSPEFDVEQYSLPFLTQQLGTFLV